MGLADGGERASAVGVARSLLEEELQSEALGPHGALIELHVGGRHRDSRSRCATPTARPMLVSA